MSKKLRSVEFLSKFLPARLNEYGTVGEDDGGYASTAIVNLHDEFSGFVIPFERDVDVGNVVDFEEFLCAVAVGAKPGRVHHNLRWVEGVVVGHCLYFLTLVQSIAVPGSDKTIN